MALGFSSTISNELLDALLNSDAYDGPANIYVKLHTGDPGSAGTSNAAGETTRKEVTWAAAASGSIANDNTITWTNYSTSETPTRFSLWDNVSAGNFLGSGTFTSNAITSGDTLNVAVGAMTASLSTAS